MNEFVNYYSQGSDMGDTLKRANLIKQNRKQCNVIQCADSCNLLSLAVYVSYLSCLWCVKAVRRIALGKPLLGCGRTTIGTKKYSFEITRNVSLEPGTGRPA